MLNVIEALRGLCYQCSPSVSLHAKEQTLVEVSHLAAGCIDTLRVLHNGDDCVEHANPHDEGKCFIYLIFS